MEKGKRFWKNDREFNIDSDYFQLADSICLLFEQRPPLTDRLSLKVIWAFLKIFHAFQYLCFAIQLVRCLGKSPMNVEEVTSIGNLIFVLTIAVLRGLSLAYHRNRIAERILMLLRCARNNRINYLVYVCDWLNSVIKDHSLDRPYYSSIYQNAIILHQQVGKGITIRAGGMFSLSLPTFTTMMKSVYSLLTLMLQSMDMKPKLK
ncbi:hypothetical protein RP20_CCG005181 [Aedes albopictus]|nr:hypothetical protein RP20_CCG005181 [Aedes albopictus]